MLTIDHLKKNYEKFSWTAPWNCPKDVSPV